MGMITGNAKICLVEYKDGAVHADAFKSRLDAVLAMLDVGSLGDGPSGSYGSEAHREALRKVKEAAEKILDGIEHPKKRECNRHVDCDAADAQAKAQGRHWAEHCHDECCPDCFGD